MAEYKGIKGFKVQYLDQDPVPAVAGWSSGGNMNTARGLAISRSRNSNCSFSFWWRSSTCKQEQQKNMMELVGQQSNPLNTARSYLAGAGTQTAALAFGGYTTSYRSNRRI
jgi:hypothetical protein